MKLIKKCILVLILIEAAIIGVSFCLNTIALTKPLIEYRSLKNAGVKIPIRDYVVRDDDKLEFDIYKDDISIVDYIWSWLWGKNFGYYMNGVDPWEKTVQCPYVGEKQKLPGSSIRKVGDGKYHVTLVLSQTLISAIIEKQCAVSPRPRKAPSADNNSRHKEYSKTSNTLFPTIYNETVFHFSQSQNSL
jgi:hypothetical protein